MECTLILKSPHYPQKPESPEQDITFLFSDSSFFLIVTIADSRAGNGIPGPDAETMLVKLGTLELLFKNTC